MGLSVERETLVESKKRLVAKSITWQGAGFVTMTVIGFLFTGSMAAVGGIALAGAVVGFLCDLSMN